MHLNRCLLLLVVAALVIVSNGLASDPQAQADQPAAQGGTCGKPAGECCAGLDASQLAQAAEKGCQASMNRLVAMAKESGNDAAVSLASQSEGGCEMSKSALIALAKDGGLAGKPAQQVSMAQLAVQAEHGCAKSTSELIARAKASGSEAEAKLAVAAEGGCADSKAALIAMVKAEPPAAAATPASR